VISDSSSASGDGTAGPFVVVNVDEEDDISTSARTVRVHHALGGARAHDKASDAAAAANAANRIQRIARFHAQRRCPTHGSTSPCTGAVSKRKAESSRSLLGGGEDLGSASSHRTEAPRDKCTGPWGLFRHKRGDKGYGSRPAAPTTSSTRAPAATGEPTVVQ